MTALIQQWQCCWIQSDTHIGTPADHGRNTRWMAVTGICQDQFARLNLGRKTCQSLAGILAARRRHFEVVFHGNLGISYQLQQPVTSLIAQRLPKDAMLLGISTVLALLIAIPMGLFQAQRRNTLGDHAFTSVSFTLYSMPDFFFALLLIAIFSVQLKILPPTVPPAASVGGLLADPRALVLPVVTLTLVTVASFSRYMRSSAIDVLTQDFIRTAKAKGLSERKILMRHVLRNSLLPVITLLGLSLPGIVAGAVIAEEVFNFPGMGLLFFQAATSHDFPILLGSTLVVGVATVVGNLLADIGYAVLDPRVRYGRT
jgi:peptide/nickel transport system permease protein